MKDIKKEDVLNLLDEIEEYRQKACENPEQYPADYMNRICAATIAHYAGFENRVEWTGELKQIPESKYNTRLKENRFHL